MNTLPQLPRRATDFINYSVILTKLRLSTKLILDLFWSLVLFGNIILEACICLRPASCMWEKATRLVHDLCEHTYNNVNRLVELNLPSLKYRGHWGDMIMIYQILHHNLNVNQSDLLTLNTSFITIGVTISNYTSQELHQESGHHCSP